jgi:hypothetical protein
MAADFELLVADEVGATGSGTAPDPGRAPAAEPQNARAQRRE